MCTCMWPSNANLLYNILMHIYAHHILIYVDRPDMTWQSWVLCGSPACLSVNVVPVNGFYQSDATSLARTLIGNLHGDVLKKIACTLEHRWATKGQSGASPSIRLGSAESDDFFYREVPQAAAKSQQRWSIGDAFEPLASRLRHSCHPVAPRL